MDYKYFGGLDVTNALETNNNNWLNKTILFLIASFFLIRETINRMHCRIRWRAYFDDK